MRPYIFYGHGLRNDRIPRNPFDRQFLDMTEMCYHQVSMMLLRHLSFVVLFGAHHMTLDLLVICNCDSHPMRKKSSRVFIVNL